MEPKSLRCMCGLTRMDGLRNEEVRRRFLVRGKMLSDRVDRKALKLFGYVRSISGDWLTKRVYESEVEVTRDRGTLAGCFETE